MGVWPTAGSPSGALLCGILIWGAGCATSRDPGASVTGLTTRITALSPAIDSREAALAAEAAHSCSQALAQEYRVVRPAIFHNVLVNMGIRQRGLCFQWADDLSAKLGSLQLHSIQIRRGCARLQTRREHSCVVLTAFGQPFEEGVVLDAWRHSGRLFWGDLRRDHYPWREVEVITNSAEVASTSLPVSDRQTTLKPAGKR